MLLAADKTGVIVIMETTKELVEKDYTLNHGKY